jgi:hypothetical protein
MQKTHKTPNTKTSDAHVLDTVDDFDGLGEELGETFVENATGADDAASEHREEETTEDKGGPFLLITTAPEPPSDADESTPDASDDEPMPATRRRSAGP